MTIYTYECTSCGSPNIKISDNMSYCECENCKKKFYVTYKNGDVLLTRLDQIMGSVVEDAAYLSSMKRLEYIDDDIAEAQQNLDLKQQAKSQEEAKLKDWFKKRQDREYYLLMGNALLMVFTFYQWYRVVFKLEGQAWRIGLLIAMGASLLFILLYAAYYFAHKLLPTDRARWDAKIDNAQIDVSKAELQLKELSIEKELCLYRKKNYHVRAVPTN